MLSHRSRLNVGRDPGREPLSIDLETVFAELEAR
jgi:hypothetical protein